jgi:hypothetical protein
VVLPPVVVVVVARPTRVAATPVAATPVVATPVVVLHPVAAS